MAGSITATIPTGIRHGQTVQRVSLTWTSDASGNVSGNATGQVVGRLQRAVFVPGAGGVQPTDLYDVTILDEHGIDVLGAGGANRSNATAEEVIPAASRVIVGTLTPVVAAAGNAKQGTIHLYLER